MFGLLSSDDVTDTAADATVDDATDAECEMTTKSNQCRSSSISQGLQNQPKHQFDQSY